MPKPGKIIKIALFIFIAVFGLIYGSYLLFKLEQEHITSLITTGITTVIGLFIAVFQILSKKDSEGSKEQMILIKEDVKDIKEMHFHIKEINQLCNKIENSAVDELETSYDIDSDFSDYLVYINEIIIRIIKNQYERGFDDIRIKAFKRKIFNWIQKYTKTSKINPELKNELLKEISSKLSEYIDTITYLMHLDNGIRRKGFIDETLNFTKKITLLSLDIYKKIAA